MFETLILLSLLLVFAAPIPEVGKYLVQCSLNYGTVCVQLVVLYLYNTLVVP